LLQQQGVDTRALVIDDASPDNTSEVAAELAGSDSRLEFRRHLTNQGHIATYNEGLLEWANSDYVLLLSADDLLTPGALARAAWVLDDHPDVGLVYGRQIMFHTEQPPPVPRLSPGRAEILSGPDFLEMLCTSAANPVATPTAVVRTTLLHKLGGYRKELPHTADLELWLRFAVHSSVGVIDTYQAYKRMHCQNMQYDYVNTALTDLRQHQAAFETLFRDCGRKIAGAQRLERLVKGKLAEKAFWAASQAFDHGDPDRCQVLLDYAEELDSDLRTRLPWSRLRWKRRLGVTSWSWLQPWVDRLRGRSPVPAGGNMQEVSA
jgi:glycosyltransferase involved in cell wall biosynthesis